jgi:hypothetical protein
MKAPNDFAPAVILSHARDYLGLSSQSVGMIGEVRWRSSLLWTGEKQVPQHFSHADEIRIHGKVHGLFDASCFWICSSGTPFVSGTIVFTQMSCRTIMLAKNEKTQLGRNAETIFGKKVVSKAAKIQCVKLP